MNILFTLWVGLVLFIFVPILLMFGVTAWRMFFSLFKHDKSNTGSNR